MNGENRINLKFFSVLVCVFVCLFVCEMSVVLNRSVLFTLYVHLLFECMFYAVILIKSNALGAIYTVCSILHSWSREQKNEQQNNAPNPKKNNAAAGYKGPVKIELLKGADLLPTFYKNY